MTSTLGARGSRDLGAEGTGLAVEGYPRLMFFLTIAALPLFILYIFLFAIKSNPFQCINEKPLPRNVNSQCLGSHGLLMEDLRLKLKYSNSDFPMLTMWFYLPKEEHPFIAHCFILVRDPHTITQSFLHSTPTLTPWLQNMKKEPCFKNATGNQLKIKYQTSFTMSILAFEHLLWKWLLEP